MTSDGLSTVRDSAVLRQEPAGQVPDPEPEAFDVGSSGESSLVRSVTVAATGSRRNPSRVDD